MRYLLAALISFLALQVRASYVVARRITNNNSGQPESPDVYWNKAFSCTPTSESYNIALRPDDASDAAEKIEAMMTEAGFSNQSGMANMYSYNANGAQMRTARQLSYVVSRKSAEMLAKKVSAFGEVSNYSYSRQSSGDSFKQLQERVAILEGEKNENREALAQMPGTSYFLQTRLNALKQSRDACSASASKSSILINLMEKTAEH